MKKNNLKIIFLSLMLIFVSSCGKSPRKETVNNSSSKQPQNSAGLNNDNLITNPVKNDDDYEIFYVVVVDTSLDYYDLHSKMVSISKKYNMPIDTMGRYYNTSKNLIVLPDSDEDEVYAGNYIPRRFPAMDTSDLTKNVPEYLSLEYLGVYQEKVAEKTIALIAGLFKNSTSADSALAIIKPFVPNAYVVKTNMYVGCIH